MIILRPYENKVFADVPKALWRSPSQAEDRDTLGNVGLQTWFRVQGKTHDGTMRWAVQFRDRDKFDAFTWSAVRAQALGEKLDWRLLSRLPVSDVYGDVDLDCILAIANVTYISGSPGSDVSYVAPVDWDNNNNSIEVYAGGASGGVGLSTGNANATGGGGGEYSKITNFVFAVPGTTSITRRVAAGAASVTRNTTGVTAGKNGGDSWWDGSSVAAASCSAQGGLAGNASTSTSSLSGGAGGSTGIGTVKRSGGRGGKLSATLSGRNRTGGGGAGGATNAGSNGGDTGGGGGNLNTAGGAGNGGLGGAGGPTNANDGSAGTEAGGGFGAGGGGSGASLVAGNSTTARGDGGNYGAGGGATTRNAASTSTMSGAGTQGFIEVTYEPKKATGFNMPHGGM